MAQQHTSTEAVTTHGTDRTHFLQQTYDWGHQRHSAKLGHHEVDHSVLVFGDKNVDRDHPVVLVLNGRAFGLQEYLTTAEARLLAKALLLAADHADSHQHLNTAAERSAADEVAA